jgi:hypothetical protein
LVADGEQADAEGSSEGAASCLAAVKTGSTDREQGLVAEVNTATALGVAKDQVFPFDGAGSDDQSRVTPTALATFYRQATQAPYATVLADSLPILGRDGTPCQRPARLSGGRQGADEDGQPRRGHARRADHRAGQQPRRLHRGQERQAAHDHGRVSNVPIATPAEFEQVTADQAKMAAAIQQAF